MNKTNKNINIDIDIININMNMNIDMDININNNISKNIKRKFMHINTNTFHNELNTNNVIFKSKLTYNELNYDSIIRKSKLKHYELNYDTFLKKPTLSKYTRIMEYQDYIELFQDLQKYKINIYNKALNPTYNKYSFSVNLFSIFPADLNDWCLLLIEQNWTYESLIIHMNIFDKNVLTYLSPLSNCENKIPDNCLAKSINKFCDNTKSVLDILYEYNT